MSSRPCDHKFVDSNVCLKCGVSIGALRAADAADWAKFASAPAVTWDTDTQYIEHRLTEVTANEQGWTLGLDGSHLFCPKDQCERAPAVGEIARLYGKGFGYVVRGIIIEGRVYKYLTEGEEQQRHAEWVADRHRAEQAQLERERTSRDERRAALPEALRERLDRFESRNPTWRRDYEQYELFVCEEAARLAAHFGSDVEALRAFADKPSTEQAVIAPELKINEHSGNTWGAAVQIASLLMMDPKLVRGAHGALWPLVGCSDYGCPGADIEKEGA